MVYISEVSTLYADDTVGIPGDSSVKLDDLLAFSTGADRIPPLGLSIQPSLVFLHGACGIYPTSSTCSLEVRLPTTHSDYLSFKDAMIAALKGHGGFGLV